MAERIKMTPLERAKQFAPFAALRGHEQQLEQVRRPLVTKRELTEDEQAVLNRRLLSKVSGDALSLIVFDGGEYRWMEGVFGFLDPVRRLLFVDGREVCLDQLIWINP